MAIASSRMGSVSHEFDIISQELSNEEKEDWYKWKEELLISAGKRSLPNFSRSRLITTRNANLQDQNSSQPEIAIPTSIKPVELPEEGPSAAQHQNSTKE